LYYRNEQEQSAFNFEHSNTDILFKQFRDAENQCTTILDLDKPLALPAYEQCIKASHLFNLLDARGVVSVTERAAYIGRVRALAKGCAKVWVAGSASARQSGGNDTV
jgi:glycyl-tRNA synthetase alpha chain